MNPLVIDALHCRNKGRIPVWFMRQAGRYMPEYRALRAKYSFLQMCHTPELMAEVTAQPITRFGMDAAIIFSDILVIPESLNVGLHFDEGTGPVIERPLKNGHDIAKLPAIDIRESLDYVCQGITLLKQRLTTVPLLGFCGAPFTLASYMIEGKSSRDLHKTKSWMLQDPTSFHALLNLLAEYAITYLTMQIEAGVSAVQIFDSWAGMLAYRQFYEFSLHYLQKIVEAIKPKAPVIVFCKGSSVFAADLAKISPSAISIDWNANMAQLRPLIRPSIALQGNLDPDLLYAPIPFLKNEVTQLLHSMHGDPGYIFNLGHGITPQTPLKAVSAVIECVKGYQ